MTYNRDLQEDKEALFDSVDQSKLILEVYTGMIPEIEVNSERTREAANDPGLLATDPAARPYRRGGAVELKWIGHDTASLSPPHLFLRLTKCWLRPFFTHNAVPIGMRSAV